MMGDFSPPQLVLLCWFSHTIIGTFPCQTFRIFIYCVSMWFKRYLERRNLSNVLKIRRKLLWRFLWTSFKGKSYQSISQSQDWLKFLCQVFIHTWEYFEYLKLLWSRRKLNSRNSNAQSHFTTWFYPLGAE